MIVSTTSRIVALVSLAAVVGCSGTEDSNSNADDFLTTAGTTTTPTAGTTGMMVTPSGGSAGMANPGGGGSAGTAVTPPAGGSENTGGSPDMTMAGAAGEGNAMAGAGGGGGNVEVDPLAVVPSAACAALDAAPDDGGPFTIETMGTKVNAADSKDGPWAYTRNYSVRLPDGYDPKTPYPLIIQGPGCGGNVGQIYPLTPIANMVIKVGIAPPPNEIGHATNPGQGCFDDKEGDDSVDWVFYENMMDLLKTKYCYDQNRVFASGNSSGAWVANELGCKYSGNASGYRIRGIMPNTGGLPVDPMFRPTCSELQNVPLIDGGAMAGMWIHENGDTENPFTGNIEAINRAMVVNGCTIGDTYQTATYEPFPIEGQGNACKKMMGCSAAYPLVICELIGTAHDSHDALANAGFSAFVQEVIAYK